MHYYYDPATDLVHYLAASAGGLNRAVDATHNRIFAWRTLEDLERQSRQSRGGGSGGRGGLDDEHGAAEESERGEGSLGGSASSGAAAVRGTSEERLPLSPTEVPNGRSSWEANKDDKALDDEQRV